MAVPGLDPGINPAIFFQAVSMATTNTGMGNPRAATALYRSGDYSEAYAQLSPAPWAMRAGSLAFQPGCGS